jgi:hypothetical protein
VPYLGGWGLSPKDDLRLVRWWVVSTNFHYGPRKLCSGLNTLGIVGVFHQECGVSGGNGPFWSVPLPGNECARPGFWYMVAGSLREGGGSMGPPRGWRVCRPGKVADVAEGLRG